MLQYDTDKLDKGLYQQALSKWLTLKWVKPQSIPEDYLIQTHYKSYNWLKRAGLYLVTLLAVQSAVGFVFFFLIQGLHVDLEANVLSFFMLFAGIGLVFLLNRYIRDNRIYKQGTDDAWLHSALCYIYFGLLTLLDIDIDTHAGTVFAAISLFCVTGFAAYQYSDSLAFAICIVCVTYIPLYLVSIISKELLFFSVLLVVPLNIVVIRTLNKWDILTNHYWYWCFMVGKIVACLLMYVSINLYIIRTLAYELMGAESIPLQPLFLMLTILTPLFFIVWGIRQKLKYLLYCGLFLLLPTVATVRYYYSVMPVEFACLIAGLLLIILCYLSIRHLRQTESNYTFEPDPEDHFSDAEILLLLQQFGKPHDSPNTPEESKYGGGNFGGAGSEGSF